ncbi:hypothetical protein M885DRAFT_469062 [Pelagophyceae sp. CCMP2097]|nr:hypothetical protein M885DRAFT_469062 [Pelagophyceae sp. CCMP2097]|mmetsp:Transcript_22659/g.76566  ORF Transcript_22659/g.76566 Transcript_22659/m.76566 type:complete len:237 (+) Transcript_22659:108-818(+)
MGLFAAALLWCAWASAFSPARVVRGRGPALCGVPIEPSKFKKGYTVEIEDSIWKILEFQETGQARQQASTRVRLRNCFTGTTIEKNFRGSDKLYLADMDQQDATFSYVDGDTDEFVFYTVDDFEEMRLALADVENGNLMPPELVVKMRLWRGRLVEVRLPETIDLEVMYVDGDSAGMKKGTTLKKTAELSTGASIQVPQFVNRGDVITIDVAERAYLRRAEGFSKQNIAFSSTKTS